MVANAVSLARERIIFSMVKKNLQGIEKCIKDSKLQHAFDLISFVLLEMVVTLICHVHDPPYKSVYSS